MFAASTAASRPPNSVQAYSGTILPKVSAGKKNHLKGAEVKRVCVAELLKETNEMPTENYKGFKISIYQDCDGDSPRDWDNLGTMVCFHKRYNLGDEHEYRHEDYSGWAALEAAIQKNENAAVVLPMYMYDHSGITINTTGFNCPWDSGQIGFIFVSKDSLRKEFGVKKLSQKHYADARKILVQEVNTYDQFLRGDVYYFSVEDAEDNQIDSCGGIYGYEYCLAKAKAEVDYKIKSLNENALP